MHFGTHTRFKRSRYFSAASSNVRERFCNITFGGICDSNKNYLEGPGATAAAPRTLANAFFRGSPSTSGFRVPSSICQPVEICNCKEFCENAYLLKWDNYYDMNSGHQKSGYIWRTDILVSVVQIVWFSDLQSRFWVSVIWIQLNYYAFLPQLIIQWGATVGQIGHSFAMAN